VPQLNQPGTFQGALSLADPRVQELNWQGCTFTGKTAVIIEQQSVIVWGGIVWTNNYKESDPTKSLAVSGQTFGSYAQHRIQAADYSTTWAAGADPMSVVHQVVSDAFTLGSIMGGISIVLNPPAGEGGPLITPSYPATALQTVDSITSILSQMGFSTGFDYSYDVTYVGGLPRVTLNLWYPRQGRTADQTQLTILQKNLIDFTYPVDSTQQGNRIAETGSGTGGVQPVLADASSALSAYGYPILDLTFSRTQVNDDGTLGNIAAGDLFQHAWPVVTPTVTLPLAVPDANGNLDPREWSLTQFYLGDDLKWLVDAWNVTSPQYGSSPRFPGGMNYEWRITGYTANPQGASNMPPNLVLNLDTPPGEGVPLPPPL
jgi:hypothetical protein